MEVRWGQRRGKKGRGSKEKIEVICSIKIMCDLLVFLAMVEASDVDRIEKRVRKDREN